MRGLSLNLAVFSHKLLWPSPRSPVGYATNGGFSAQMDALAGVFSSLTLCAPVSPHGRPDEENPFHAPNLSIAPLPPLRGEGLPRKIRFIPWALSNLVPCLHAAHKADVIHTPIPGDIGSMGIFCAMLLGKPLIVRHCGNWLCDRTLAEYAWKILMSETAGERNTMFATGGSAHPPALNRRLAWIFSSSLRRAEIPPPPQQSQIDPASVHPLRLVMAGRLAREKGAHIAIDTVDELRRQGLHVQLTLIGDGPERPALEKQVTSLQLHSHVHFSGMLPQKAVMRQLARHDLFIFPTYASEGFPKVVLEAMACGLPVITTPVSVLPTLIGRDAGIIVSKTDRNSFTHAIISLIRNPQRRQMLSANAHSRALSYTLENWASRFRLQAHLAADIPFSTQPPPQPSPKTKP